MATVTCEIMWIVKILEDLKIKHNLPVDMFCDNKAAMQIAANPVLHERTKHIEIDIHIVREKVSSGLLKTVKIESAEQSADVFTKSLSSNQHSYLCKKLNLLDLYQH